MQYLNTINLYYLVNSELIKLGIDDNTKLKVMEYLFKNDMNLNAGGWEFVSDEVDFVITDEDRYRIKFKTIYSNSINEIEIFKEVGTYRTTYTINIFIGDETISIISDNESIVYNMDYNSNGSRNEYVFIEDDKIEKIRIHEFDIDNSLTYDHTEFLEESIPVENIPTIINKCHKDNKVRRLHK